MSPYGGNREGTTAHRANKTVLHVANKLFKQQNMTLQSLTLHSALNSSLTLYIAISHKVSTA